MSLKKSASAVIDLFAAVLFCGTAHAGNSSGYAWSENAGWANFNPAGGGVSVYDDHLEGYVWHENIGWIRLGTFTAGTAHTYTNTANSNYGVNNDGAGILSGYGWSENAGWVNFSPAGRRFGICRMVAVSVCGKLQYARVRSDLHRDIQCFVCSSCGSACRADGSDSESFV